MDEDDETFEINVLTGEISKDIGRNAQNAADLSNILFWSPFDTVRNIFIKLNRRHVARLALDNKRVFLVESGSVFDAEFDSEAQTQMESHRIDKIVSVLWSFKKYWLKLYDKLFYDSSGGGINSSMYNNIKEFLHDAFVRNLFKYRVSLAEVLIFDFTVLAVNSIPPNFFGGKVIIEDCYVTDVDFLSNAFRLFSGSTSWQLNLSRPSYIDFDTASLQKIIVLFEEHRKQFKHLVIYIAFNTDVKEIWQNTLDFFGNWLFAHDCCLESLFITCYAVCYSVDFSSFAKGIAENTTLRSLSLNFAHPTLLSEKNTRLMTNCIENNFNIVKGGVVDQFILTDFTKDVLKRNNDLKSFCASLFDLLRQICVAFLPLCLCTDENMTLANVLSPYILLEIVDWLPWQAPLCSDLVAFNHADHGKKIALLTSVVNSGRRIASKREKHARSDGDK